ncbi:MAG: cell division protein FtsA [Firmicutes bacterium]|nr:cell division protein FtsA [Bacillota bacterium]
MSKRDITVGLDIGTTKICALICERGDSGEPEVIGVGTSVSAGLRRGVVVDIDAAAAAVSDAVARAENMSGCAVVSVTASLSGAHVSSMGSRGVVAVARPDREITSDDVARVLEAARVVAIPPDREVVHVLPKEFIIDGCRGIKKPVGMSGIRLEVDTHIITGSATSIQNVKKSSARAGLEIDHLVLQPVASAEAVLTPSEKELGVLLMDVGGGTTDIAVFVEGSPWHTSVIPVGGKHITNDIALVLRLPVPAAETLKVKRGCALASMVREEEMCGHISGEADIGTAAVPRRELCSIIEARVTQIMEMVRAEVERAGLMGQLPSGVVVTGGAAAMPGFVEAAQQALRLPARLGIPTGVSGLADVVSSPAHAAAVGLVKYSWEESAGRGHAPASRRQAGFMTGVRQWFRDIFSP